MDTCIWYNEELVLLFFVDDCLIFSSYKYKIGEAHASLQAYFKIEDDVELKIYLGIELYRRPDISIHVG